MANRQLTKLPGVAAESYSCDNIAFGTDFQIDIIFFQQSGDPSGKWLGSFWNEGSSNRAFAFELSSTGIRVYESVDGSGFAFSDTFPLPKGEIHQFSFFKNGTAAGVIIDGVTTPFTSTFGTAYVADGTATKFWLGSKDGTANPMVGYILAASVTIAGGEAHRWVMNGDGSAPEPDLIGDRPMSRNGLDEANVSLFDRTSELVYDDGVETLTYAVAPTKWAVWLLGQSNMVSLAGIGAGVDDVYENALGALQWGLDSQALAIASNPLDSADELAGTMGSWLGFANILSATALVPFGYDITFIPCADGGTSMATSWQKGGIAYDAAVASYNAFKVAYPNAELAVALMFQGETDADNGRSTAQYKTDFYQMRTDMIADVTDFTSLTPMVLAKILGSTTPANIPAINTAIEEISSETSSISYVENSDLTIVDTWHLDAASQRIMGQRYAAKYELAVSGNTITVSFVDAPSDGGYHVYLETAAGVTAVNAPVTISAGRASIDIVGFKGERLLGYIYHPDAFTAAMETAIDDNMALLLLEVPA